MITTTENGPVTGKRQEPSEWRVVGARFAVVTQRLNGQEQQTHVNPVGAS